MGDSRKRNQGDPNPGGGEDSPESDRRKVHVRQVGLHPQNPVARRSVWSPSNDARAKRVDPREHGAMCASCPFAREGAPVNPVWGEGPSDSPLGVLVGEGPGRDEAERGRPFVGSTGQALDVEMFHAGLVRDQLLIVNATCCVPTQPKKEPEMRKAVECCRPAFLSQLQHLPRNIPILAMGKWAYFGLTGKDKGVMKARGFIRWKWRIPINDGGDK